VILGTLLSSRAGFEAFIFGLMATKCKDVGAESISECLVDIRVVIY
jgi:hypothetical protein